MGDQIVGQNPTEAAQIEGAQEQGKLCRHDPGVSSGRPAARASNTIFLES